MIPKPDPSLDRIAPITNPETGGPLDAIPERETHVYRTVDRCEIKADVVGARSGAKKPCLVWIHGGGLIFGSRKVSPRENFLRSLLQRDFVVISIDHRLAPETKLPAIVDDVRHAWHWIFEQGSKQFGIDTSRVAIGGASAGAYLALMGGYSLRPRPRALASFWGFGDITASWEAEPNAFYRESPLVAKDEADRSVGVVPVSEPSPEIDRGYFYLYCRQQGRWLIEVTGHDPGADAPWFNPYCPIRNIAPGYPPTILVHGTMDTDVPHQESRNLALCFEQLGVPHEFLSLEGVGHGFTGARPEDVERVEATVAAFLEAGVRARP
jgi:acetyl esterase/lipase